MNGYRKVLLFLSILVTSLEGAGQGISFDAGLTPAQGRFILRTQYRQMEASSVNTDMTTRMVPLVVAYGVRRDVTLVVRNMYFHRTFSTTDVNLSGINDPYLLVKYKLFRKNTSAWVLGVAPHLAVNVPVGTVGIGTNTWNPDIGLNISFRPRFYAVDFSMNYRIEDITVKSADSGPDQFAANLAASRMVPLNASGSSALAPVIEMNYLRDVGTGGDATAGEQIVMLSPGCSFITSAFTIEALLQLPVYQESETGMRQKYRLIAGMKFLF